MRRGSKIDLRWATLSCALTATRAFWRSTTYEVPVVSIPVAPVNEVFSEWPRGSNQGEYDTLPPDPHCNFWNGSVYFDPSACNSFVVTRMSARVYSHAMDRAMACSLAHETDCVLSGEIGFSVPAVFVPDPEETGLQMLVAPQIVAAAPDRPTRHVRMQDPSGMFPNQIITFNHSITVEYLRGDGARSMQTSVLEGPAAYCVQALRHSIVPSCWAGLD